MVNLWGLMDPSASPVYLRPGEGGLTLLGGGLRTQRRVPTSTQTLRICLQIFVKVRNARSGGWRGSS